MLFEKKPSSSDKARVKKETIKQFGKISKRMEKIGEDMRNLLPVFQKLPIFSSSQVTRLSKFIDEYDKFKQNVYMTFDNKINPEDWNK